MEGLDWSEERALFEELGEFYYSEDDDVCDKIFGNPDDYLILEKGGAVIKQYFKRQAWASESINRTHICAYQCWCEKCPLRDHCEESMYLALKEKEVDSDGAI